MELELALRAIQEDNLASWFEEIRTLLEANNFWTDNIYDIEKLPTNAQAEFQLLKKKITGNDQMWDLDKKILTLRV